ncbi:hypothetical protein [Paenibacillus sp. 2TAB19]
MQPVKWTKEELWVARDDQGRLIRVLEKSPEELVKDAEKLRQKAK